MNVVDFFNVDDRFEVLVVDIGRSGDHGRPRNQH